MIQIITDSMSDVRQEEAQAYAITVLPQPVLFGEESFMDGVDLGVREFYERLETCTELPKTSQVSPDAFAKAFGASLGRGDEILYIGGSSKLSGNFQSASIAQSMQEENAPIYLIDSRNASLGQQLLVWEAVRLRDEGEGAQAIAQRLTGLVQRVSLVGKVENLRHLVMGGRLSSAKALLGATLSLKPMLRLKDGKLEQDGVTRGKKRAFEWLKKQMEAAPRDPSFPVCIAAADAREELEEFRAYLEAEGAMEGGIRMTDVGPIVGTHTGKGVLALSWVRL